MDGVGCIIREHEGEEKGRRGGGVVRAFQAIIKWLFVLAWSLLL